MEVIETTTAAIITKNTNNDGRQTKKINELPFTSEESLDNARVVEPKTRYQPWVSLNHYEELEQISSFTFCIVMCSGQFSTRRVLKELKLQILSKNSKGFGNYLSSSIQAHADA